MERTSVLQLSTNYVPPPVPVLQKLWNVNYYVTSVIMKNLNKTFSINQSIFYIRICQHGHLNSIRVIKTLDRSTVCIKALLKFSISTQLVSWETRNFFNWHSMSLNSKRSANWWVQDRGSYLKMPKLTVCPWIFFTSTESKNG